MLLASPLNAIEINWQFELPPNAGADYIASGKDGSAVVIDTAADTLYWIGTNGTLIETISNFNGTNPTYTIAGSTYVSSNLLILPVTGTSYRTKVITKDESTYTTETLDGWPEEETPFQSSSSFFIIRSGSTLTQYRFDEADTTLSGIQSVPANAIVIPALYHGNVSVTLESSVDLVDWTPVLPGTFSGQDNARFFRVKATAQD